MGTPLLPSVGSSPRSRSSEDPILSPARSPPAPTRPFRHNHPSYPGPPGALTVRRLRPEIRTREPILSPCLFVTPPSPTSHRVLIPFPSVVLRIHTPTPDSPRPASPWTHGSPFTELGTDPPGSRPPRVDPVPYPTDGLRPLPSRDYTDGDGYHAADWVTPAVPPDPVVPGHTSGRMTERVRSGSTTERKESQSHRKVERGSR